MQIGEFTLVNAEKLSRAIDGTPQRAGEAIGGVGKDASPAEIIAAYDKLGGLILKGKRKVKTGSFWNFTDNKPWDEPQVVYILRGVDNVVYEIEEGEEAPLEVQVAEKQANEEDEEADTATTGKKAKVSKVKVASSKKSKKSVEDAE